MNNQLDIQSTYFPNEILLNFFELSNDKDTQKAMKCVDKLWSNVFNSPEAKNIELGLDRWELSSDVVNAVKPLFPSNVFVVKKRPLSFYANVAENLVKRGSLDENKNELSVVLSLVAGHQGDRLQSQMKKVEKKRKREEREERGEVVSPLKKARGSMRLNFSAEEYNDSESNEGDALFNMHLEELLRSPVNGELAWKRY